MKEYDKNIDKEDIHRIIYPLIVQGELVGQHTFEGDIFIKANEEKHPVVKPVAPDTNVASKHPLQGEFVLSPKFNNSYNPIPYRSGSPRGRRG